ncbi:MAG TPA: hypothetical protein VF669_00130 [Tepidisphaeraceae bacterium]|jgi:hypothetical protein
MRIYLDVCCLNRPIGRNRLEAEAVLAILDHVRAGHWQLIGSDAIDLEVSLMPSMERRLRVAALAGLRSETVTAGGQQRARAVELVTLGISYMERYMSLARNWVVVTCC